MESIDIIDELNNDIPEEEVLYDGYASGTAGMQTNNDLENAEAILANQEFQQQQASKKQEASQDQGALPDGFGNFIGETAKAVVGGGADAIDSVGSFLDLSGDTLKTGVNAIMGKQDDKNNPFSDQYQAGAWWDLDDNTVPENNSGYGKLVRGLVEFGLLSTVTGGIGGKVGAVTKLSKVGAKIGKGIYKGSRAAGVGRQGSKVINYVSKLPIVAAQGSIADAIMQSSEIGNIANLVNEHAPWIPFSEALAVDPEKDSAWISRMKSVTAGAGMNLLGHFLGTTVRMAWKANKAVRKGMPVDEANAKFSKEGQQTMDVSTAKDVVAFDGMKKLSEQDKRGMLGRDFRREYNEKYLGSEKPEPPSLEEFQTMREAGIPADKIDMSEGVSDIEEYLRIRDGGMPSESTLRKLEDLHPSMDIGLMSDAAIREQALIDFDNLANRIGQRKGDKWNDEMNASLSQLADLAAYGPDNFVDWMKHRDVEKATYRPFGQGTPREIVERNLYESDFSMRNIDDVPHSASPLTTEAAFKKLTRGDVSVQQYLKEIVDTLSTDIFRKGQALDSLGRKMSRQQIQYLILRQTDDLHSILVAGGKDVADNMRRYLTNNDQNRIMWMHDGEAIVTMTAPQKAASQLLVYTLGKQIESIATAADTLGKQADRPLINRQLDQIYDMINVLLLEQKKLAYMSGNTLLQQKNFVLDDYVRKSVDDGIKQIVSDQAAYNTYLRKISREMGPRKLADLVEMHRLSGGVVQRLEHIHEYLERYAMNPLKPSSIKFNKLATRVNGEYITPRFMKELSSVYYNSLLSNITTPFKAIFSTNLIATLRPAMAFLGATSRFDKKEAMIALTQLHGLVDVYKESLSMFKHNWDLGVNRQAQTYAGKFNLDSDLAKYSALERYYNQYGTSADKAAYNALKGIIDFNTSPFARYSVNLMGSGDAAARTLIGRLEMRQRAARKAIEEGNTSYWDIFEYAKKNESNFRDEIFVKSDNRYVVSDKAAEMAGNDAALTTALPENLKVFETLQRLPGGQFFFPFVRTSYNALRLTFAHTELERFTRRYDDIMNGKNLDAYGIRPEDLAGAQALMRGRMTAGNAIGGLAYYLALNGKITGDMPFDREEREQWKSNQIQPNSFKFGTEEKPVYVSYRNLEPFNTILSVTSTFATNTHLLGEDERDNMTQKIAFMFGSVLVDKSMFAGVDDLITLMNADSSGAQITNTMAGLARRSLPYSGLLAGLGNMMQAHEVEANTFSELMFKRDLALKQSLPAKYDILSKDRTGKKFVPNANIPLLRIFNSISPVAINLTEGDPVKEALMDIGFNLPDEVTQYNGEPLTSFERSELQRILSMDVDFRRDLEIITKDPDWLAQVQEYKDRGLLNRDGARVSKTQFYNAVRTIFTEAKDRAMLKLRAQYSDLDNRLELSEYKTNLTQQSGFAAVEYLINEFPK